MGARWTLNDSGSVKCFSSGNKAKKLILLQMGNLFFFRTWLSNLLLVVGMRTKSIPFKLAVYFATVWKLVSKTFLYIGIKFRDIFFAVGDDLLANISNSTPTGFV